MPDLTQVKKTKVVIPRRRPDVLRRQRLVDLLHGSVDQRLVLVSAPAGYGKSTLLVDFASETEIPVCWYTLDASSQDPRVFIEHLIASIRTKFPSFGEKTLAALDAAAGLTLDGLYPVHVALVNELYDCVPEYLILILDDFHVVDRSDTVAGFVGRLLEDAPENLCLIVSSRTVPGKLPLLTLTSRRQVIGLGALDLRFTVDEVRDLVQQNYHIELSANDAAELARDAEGWITGILLSTHSLWQGLLGGLIRARGRGTLYDFLASEVFNQQPDDIQRFLLGTSVLDDMSPALCNEVLGIVDAGDKLRLIEERNLFVTRLEGEELWYRYHHLFREYLSMRLRRQEPQWRTELYRTAAGAFRKSGDNDLAVSSLLEAGDLDEAAELIADQSASLYRSGRWTTLTHWCERFPASYEISSVEFLVYAGRSYIQLGNLDRAEALLSKAETLAKRRGDEGMQARAMAERGGVARRQGRYADAESLATQALAMAPASDRMLQGWAHKVLGTAVAGAGRFPEAVGHLESALGLFGEAGSTYDTALIHVDICYALEHIGDLPGALEHLEIATEMLRAIGNPGELANALNSLGVLYHQRGEYRRASVTLHEALSAADKSGSLRWLAYTYTSLGDLARDLGELSEALDHYDRALNAVDDVKEGFLLVYLRAAAAEVLARTGEPLQASDLARQAIDTAMKHKSSYERSLGLVGLGLALLAVRPIDALAPLSEAVSLLDGSGAMRDLARARFLLASAQFLAGRRDAALAELAASLELADRIGARQMLQASAGWAKGLLDYARRQDLAVQDLLVPPSLTPAPTPMAVEPVVNAKPTGSPLELRGFGASRILVDGKEPLSSWAKARELIFFLTSATGDLGRRKEEIALALWPDLAGPRAKSNLHSISYRIRRALAPEEPLRFADGRYKFVLGAESFYDVQQFERLAEQGERAKDPAQAIDQLEKAAALVQGDYLQDMLADWCEPKRQELADRLIDVLRRIVLLRQRAGDHPAAIAAAQRWADIEPADEDACRALMESHLVVGDRGAALRRYQRMQAALLELGLEPSGPMQDMYRKITAQ